MTSTNKNVTTAALSGAAAAAVVGTAVYMMNGKSRTVHKIKRNAAKTVHATGSIVSGVSEMLR